MAFCPTQTLEEAVDRVIEDAARGADAADTKLALNGVAAAFNTAPSEVIGLIQGRHRRQEYGPMITRSMGSANQAVLGMV